MAITDIVDSATNAVGAVTKTLSSVTSIAGAVSGVTGALGALANIFTSVPGLKLPMPNILHNYATWNYIIGFGCLTDKQINDPDNTYKMGQKIALICKDANADPNNRVVTPYGKFDFFINNVELKSTIGLDAGNTTNITNVTFQVTEPYSMGMFPISCQALAQNLGHDNFREAPYVLTIEFRGNTQTGGINSIPGTTRHIPITITDIQCRVTEAGSVYNVTAMPFNQGAITDVNALFKNDTSITGDTVQSILQTGEKSLQAVVNQKLKDTAKAAKIDIPDEILILFPIDPATATSAQSAADNTENNSTATSNGTSAQASAVFEKLGVTRSSINQTLIQQASDCNAIGSADLGFDDSRKGDTPIGKDNKVYDDDKQVYVRGKNTIDIKQSDMKFKQDTDIPNAINQVILSSKFVTDTLDATKLSPEGYRGWWRIDTQMYNIGPTQDAQGTKPKLIVYRVVPYNVHASRIMPPNTRSPGFASLKQQAVKEYNYIYTGKNVDVITFEININQGFSTIMAADGLEKSQDAKTTAQTGDAADPVKIGSPLGPGNPPSKELGTTPTIVRYIGTLFGSDKKGGGGQETPGHRAARIFMDAVTNGTDLYNLTIKIIGDPYYIVQSGIGNYTAKQTQFSNLNLDGSVNYQNGEVDIYIAFRTPIDINQTSGLYDFGKGRSAPVIQYSGLYCVTNVVSTFKDGKFEQVLTGFRRPQQENLVEATPDKTLNVTNQAPNTKDKYNTGEGYA